MKRVISIALVCLLLAGLILASCGQVAQMSQGSQNMPEGSSSSVATQAAQTAQYRKIDAAQAKEMMEQNPKAIILDVRTQQEFDEIHIEGAVLLPDFELADRAAAELPDKDALVLVYCRSGNRSRSAANTLLGLGYTNVFDFGGITDWPFETVSAQ